jgi:hypothetical protein
MLLSFGVEWWLKRIKKRVIIIIINMILLCWNPRILGTICWVETHLQVFQYRLEKTNEILYLNIKYFHLFVVEIDCWLILIWFSMLEMDALYNITILTFWYLYLSEFLAILNKILSRSIGINSLIILWSNSSLIRINPSILFSRLKQIVNSIFNIC